MIWDLLELFCAMIGTLICVYLASIGEYKPLDWYEKEDDECI